MLDRHVFLAVPLFLVLGVFTAALISAAFLSFLPYAPPPDLVGKTPSLENYAHFLSDQYYLRSISNTFRISLESALLAIILSFPIGYRLSRRVSARFRKIILGIVVSSMFVSAIVRAFSFVLILSASGAVSFILLRLGAIDKPVSLLYNDLAVIVGITSFLVPYGILTMAAGLSRVRLEFEEAARSLGADNLQVFRRVILPLSIPAICTTLSLLFALATAAFVAPLVLGGGIVPFATVDVYRSTLELVDLPTASTVSMVFTGLALSAVLAFDKILMRGSVRLQVE